MDDADHADPVIAHNLAMALAVRKPVPTRCEDCDEPCAVLPNGVRARWCHEHLAEFMGSGQ